MSIDSKETGQMSRHVEGANPISSALQIPKYTAFVSESARLKSFEHGRVGAGQSALDLSRAGFLYFGTTPIRTPNVLLRIHE